MTGKTVSARFLHFASPSADPDLNDRARLRRSLTFTALFWILVAALSLLLVHTKERDQKRAFQSIQINLASVQSDSAKKSARASSATGRPLETKAAKPAKEQSAASPRVNREGRASGRAEPVRSSGLGIPDFAPSSRDRDRSNSDADFLEFGTTEGTPDAGVPSRTGEKAAPAAIPEIEGTAATVQKKPGGSVRSSSGEKDGDDGAPRASAETTRALNDIAGSSGAGSASRQESHGAGKAGGAKGSQNVEGAVSAAPLTGLSFEGTPRKALFSPPIVLPDNLARLVDASVSVTIAFTVLADGSVPAAFVDFIPQAALPPAVRDYLVKEFSRWRFEKSDQDGHALFLYSIRVQ